jgi:hypothetical protein
LPLPVLAVVVLPVSTPVAAVDGLVLADEEVFTIPLVETGGADATPEVDAGPPTVTLMLWLEADEDAEPDEPEDDPDEDEEACVPMSVGAATAVEGSRSFPIPHPIGFPSGWVGFGGGTDFPSLSVMRKRVVQMRLLEAGEENW